MSDAVPVNLEDLDTRDGWILESRIDRKDGTGVGTLLVELLLESILCSSARTSSCAVWISCKKVYPAA